MKILVIDKSEVSRFILDQCLTSLGHVFHFASAAEEALLFLRSHSIDFVFIDLDSGRERAGDTIKSIRAAHQSEWFPIVALSSETDDDAFANAILAGADAQITKPLHRNRIVMQVIALERIYMGRQSLQAKKDLIAADLALLKLSMYDEITGLANRRYFEETLIKEIRLAKRERRRLTLLVCEIENLAQPSAGGDSEFTNRRLHAIAAAIACIPSRPTDFICRYDDNSFAVILPNTDQQGAQHIADKIRGSIETVLTQTTTNASTAPLTCRIGSATDDGQFQTSTDFIHAASATLRNGQTPH